MLQGDISYAIRLILFLQMFEIPPRFKHEENLLNKYSSPTGQEERLDHPS